MDGEPAIHELKTEIISFRTAETIPEECPVGEHGSNLVGGAVRRVREQTRVGPSQLEKRAEARCTEAVQPCSGL